jgi:hypothetical protein
MNSYVFLTESSDFTEAQVLKSYLQSSGFHPRVRDEQIRTIAPHLQNLMGKLIIEVPEYEFLAASEALENLEKNPRASFRLKIADQEATEERLVLSKELAKKALVNAILGCTFVPLLCNLYSLTLSWRVIRQERPLTAVSGKRLMLAISFNCLGLYIWLTFGMKYFLRAL